MIIFCFCKQLEKQKRKKGINAMELSATREATSCVAPPEHSSIL
jgi:hypothetical protein